MGFSLKTGDSIVEESGAGRQSDVVREIHIGYHCYSSFLLLPCNSCYSLIRLVREKDRKPDRTQNVKRALDRTRAILREWGTWSVLKVRNPNKNTEKIHLFIPVKLNILLDMGGVSRCSQSSKQRTPSAKQGPRPNDE